MPDFADHAGLRPEQVRDLADELARLTTLEEVMKWALPRGSDILEVIVQDEYCHDVVIDWQAQMHLVFDTT